MNFIYNNHFTESLTWGVQYFFMNKLITPIYRNRVYVSKLKNFTYTFRNINDEQEINDNNHFSFFIELQQFLTNKKVVGKFINKEV